MDLIVKRANANSLKTQCAVVFALDNTLQPSAKLIDKEADGTLSHLLKSKALKNKAGSHCWVHLAPNKKRAYEHVLLVSLGQAEKKSKSNISSKDYISSIQSGLKALSDSHIKNAAVYLDQVNLSDADNSPLTAAQLFATEAVRVDYKYATTKTSDKDSSKLDKLTLVLDETKQVNDAKKGLKLGQALGNGINTTRELGNLPGNICTPEYLANQAKKLATSSAKLTTKVLTEKQIEKLGMGAFLSVAKGSAQDGKLIIMEYRGGTKTAKPNVIVGKGITFDTGGISLKPGLAMDEMKFDMCGAASVMGVMTALVELQASVNVVAIIAAAENMPSGRASKPGDVVTSMSGQTIEILNTDAEGRLVLCDALTYAERYKPKSVVDIATLTGACVVALGSHATGLYSNDQALADKLLASGEKMHDRAWQMPLWDEYQQQLESNFADMANIGGPKAGSVTAACFLSRFTKKYPWAHLDIAGTAWEQGGAKGATGRPVALLLDYLLNA